MATYDKLKNKISGHDIQVQSAIEDKSGNDIENTYLKKDGYSQTAGVGHADFADAISTDREIDDADEACPAIVFDTVGGSAEVQNGQMKFEELRGNSIAWNQLCKDPTFATANMWGGGTVANNKLVATGIGGSISQNISMSNAYGNNFPLVNGHVYIYSFVATVTSATTNTSLRLYNTGTYNEWAYPGTFAIPANKRTLCICRHQYNKTSSQNGTAYIYLDYTGTGYPANQTFTVENFQVFDLTRMFGAGNEPETTDDFLKLFPAPVYAYNGGAIINSKSASLISRGFNQWDEQWEEGRMNSVTGQNENGTNQIRSKNYIKVLPNTEYYFDANFSNGIAVFYYDANYRYIGVDGGVNGVKTTPKDCSYVKFYTYGNYGTTYLNNICVYINWDTPGLPYQAYESQTVTLPNLELKSAGSVYDVAYQEGGGVRRVGTYTFTGNETWYKGDTQTTGGLYRYYTFAFRCKSATAGQGICTKYDNLGSNWNSSTTEGVMFGYTNTYLYFLSATDRTTTEVQTLFNGVTVNYQLETDTDISEVDNPGWDEYVNIDNYGTIEFTTSPAQVPQVPQAYFIRYTVNLVEFLDTAYVTANGDATTILTTATGVEKDTSTSTYYRVYGKYLNGDQTMFNLTPSQIAGAIPQRDSNAQIYVPQLPTEYDHASSKKYVDDTALKAAGGTLKQLLSINKSIGLNSLGAVNLGTLTWYYLSSSGHEAMYTTSLQSTIKPATSDSDLANILCTEYTAVTRTQQYNQTADNVIAISDDGTVYVYSTTMGTNAANFKAAMQGVMLAYEKA